MEKHTMQDGTIPLSGLSLLVVCRQWGVFQINHGSGSFQLPLSSTILSAHLQHRGVSAQYNGLDETRVVSSLDTNETLSFLAICK